MSSAILNAWGDPQDPLKQRAVPVGAIVPVLRVAELSPSSAFSSSVHHSSSPSTVRSTSLPAGKMILRRTWPSRDFIVSR